MEALGSGSLIRPDQWTNLAPLSRFGITWPALGSVSGVKEKGTKVLKRSGFFKLFLRFLSSSGTCGSSGELQPDQARPMDEFGTVVITLDHLASIGIRVWSERKRPKC